MSAAANDPAGTAGHRNRFTDPAEARAYIEGGHGRVTLVSLATGTRYTYRITRGQRDGHAPEEQPLFFRLRTGAGEDDEQYVGLATPELEYRYQRGRSPHPAARAMAWLLERLRAGRLPANAELWHEGVCCRCGRALTVPSSIASGIGPTCAGR